MIPAQAESRREKVAPRVPSATPRILISESATRSPAPRLNSPSRFRGAATLPQKPKPTSNPIDVRSPRRRPSPTLTELARASPSFQGAHAQYRQDETYGRSPTREDLVHTRVARANQAAAINWRAPAPGASKVFCAIDSPIALAFLRRYRDLARVLVSAGRRTAANPGAPSKVAQACRHSHFGRAAEL